MTAIPRNYRSDGLAQIRTSPHLTEFASPHAGTERSEPSASSICIAARPHG
jgi:hypothetical protein